MHVHAYVCMYECYVVIYSEGILENLPEIGFHISDVLVA